MPRCYVRCRWGRRNLVSRSCLDFSVGLDRRRRLGFVTQAVLLTLPAYSHFRRTYTIFVDSLFSHALRGLIVLAVSVTPGMVSSRLFSHALRGLVVLAVSVTPGVVSSRLFSHALRGFVVLTHLVWACCSRGIRHAQRGLFAALLTRLAWARCSQGVVVAVPVTGIER